MSVRQRKEEHPVVSLMHVGLVAGTPVCPKLAFTVDVLDVFYHLRRQQPSFGVRGFVKAVCAFQQVCNPLLSPLQTNVRQFKYVSSMDQLFSRAFDVFSEVQRRLQARDDTALGRDSPNWQMKYGCPACGFEVRFPPYFVTTRLFAFSN
jgi:hypothetical protein